MQSFIQFEALHFSIWSGSIHAYKQRAAVRNYSLTAAAPRGLVLNSTRLHRAEHIITAPTVMIAI